MIRYHRVEKHRPPMFFALSMFALLVGCGEGTDALNSGSTEENRLEFSAALPELGAPPTQISPSISAAQLLNDRTLTVGLAQAVAAGEASLPVVAPTVSPTVPTAVSETEVTASAPAVLTPSAQAPSAQVPTVQAPTVQAPTVQAPTVQAPTAQIPIVAAAAPAESPVAVVTPTPAATDAPAIDSAIDNTIDSTNDSTSDTTVEEPEIGAALATAELAPETTAEVTLEPAAAEPEASEIETTESPTAPTTEQQATEPQEPESQPTDNAERQTRFTGSTSPTFSGEILDDGSVQLNWDVDPGARGYNVYRDAEYIQTVFEASYNDAFDAFDRNYYYEIQAFTPDEIYSTIATGLTVSMSGTGRTDPNDPQPEEGLLDDYELVFSDEFNGDSLDLSKWNTAYLWGDDLIINSELQHYVDIANDPDFGFNPFTFDGESLTINTVRTPPELLESANGQAYLSGVITSYDAFQFTYGYVEARVKVPFGKGYWPAFWLLNAFYDQDKPEIDIMEFIGDNQDTAYHTYHYYDEEGNLRSTKSEPTFPIDFPADFHTFGAEWSPGTVTFYVDGIARHTISDPKMSQEQMYIIANTAVGGWWPGDPDENTEFPGEYKIDYIRAYQRVGVQLDPPMFANPNSDVPVRGDRDFATPGHLPPFELFPQGYPEL